jgi:hypothetical protein
MPGQSNPFMAHVDHVVEPVDFDYRDAGDWDRLPSARISSVGCRRNLLRQPVDFACETIISLAN